jgi:Na+-translocating ferredoxin:NAD+ oxidoreductase RnfD subunit
MYIIHIMFSLASAPPVDVVATQPSSFAPVEVSWSPPSDAAPATIIGYRVFYGNGQNLFIPSYVTRIVLNFVESSQIESVSVRSESTQLPSELTTATVAIAGKLYQNKYR